MARTPEQTRRLQDRNRRYDEAEKDARRCWLAGLENEQEAIKALEEENMTQTRKRRVSISARDEIRIIRDPPETSSAPTNSDKPANVGEPFRVTVPMNAERCELLLKEMASLRATLAELKVAEAKAAKAEADALAQKYQEGKAALKEKDRLRREAEEKALKAKKAAKKALARARQEEHEAWLGEQDPSSTEMDELDRKRGVFDERSLSQEQDTGVCCSGPSHSSTTPTYTSVLPSPEGYDMGQQHPPACLSPSSSSCVEDKPRWDHPNTDPSPSASPVPRAVGFSGLPAESLCSESSRPSVPVGLSGLPVLPSCSDGNSRFDTYQGETRGGYSYSDISDFTEDQLLQQEDFPSPHQSNWSTSSAHMPSGLPSVDTQSLWSDDASEIARYEDEDRDISSYPNAYESNYQATSYHDHSTLAPIPRWSTPPVPAWRYPTPEPQVEKQTWVVPAQAPYHAEMETPREQWSQPPTPALTNCDDRCPCRTAPYTLYYDAEEYLSPSGDERNESRFKAHTRANSPKLTLPVETNPAYVPPTPYWHPSHPSGLFPTPRQGPSVAAFAVADQCTLTYDPEKNDDRRNCKTPVPPGGWVED